MAPSSDTNADASDERKDSDLVLEKPDKIGDADFANYFCTYGYLYHQKDMLEDTQRMTAYYDAVRKNPRAFKDKVVLDVGTGSGIFAIWAAQAGAKKVYAVEATYMATHARKLIAANGLENVITVMQIHGRGGGAPGEGGRDHLRVDGVLSSAREHVRLGHRREG